MFFRCLIVVCYTTNYSHSFPFSPPLYYKYLNLNVDGIKPCAEAWYEANARSNTRKEAERERLQKAQQGDVPTETVDLTDINKLFEEKGQGPHMLEMEFEPTTEAAVEYVSNRTGKPTSRWTWRHKLTQSEVHRYKTKSGKSFDTGVLSQNLHSLKQSQHKVAFQRAMHILQLNGKKGRSMYQDVKDGIRVLKREDLVKQWVSNRLLFLLFAASNTIRTAHHVCCSLSTGLRRHVLHRGKLSYYLSPGAQRR